MPDLVSYRCSALLTALFAIANISPAQSSGELTANLARGVLQQGASNKDPETRRETARAFSLNSSRDDSFAVLESLLKDKDYLCREAAITSVSEMGEPQLAKLVRPALADDVPEVMFAAARALYKLQDPDGKRALVEILEKEEKARSGFLPGKFRDTARRLKTPKSALLFAVQQGTGFVPVPGVGAGYSAMTAMLADKDLSPRAVSLLMLSSDRSADVRTMVERAFGDDDWSVRAAAIQITANWNEGAWQSRLIPLLGDSKGKVRFRAAAVFLRLQHSTGAADTAQ